MRHRVHTKYGSYIVDDSHPVNDNFFPTGEMVFDLLDVDTSLNTRITNDIKELKRLHAKPDLSLEELATLVHSLIHKVTESISKKKYTQATTAWNAIETCITKFHLPNQGLINNESSQSRDAW